MTLDDIAAVLLIVLNVIGFILLAIVWFGSDRK